ncbi:outer membrane beta-barrel protein [Sphingobacterium sp. SG20118]|uniref:outer membrane beta-barrel protein n=1 Tax=Sphingobacterium sp. SG20118 TaxID=3367156 RepID=UPI0037DFBE28
MNKYILSSFLILSASVAFAQQSKLFIEVGGSYQQSNDKQHLGNSKYSYFRKAPIIGTGLGYQLSGHSTIGIQYSHEKVSYEQNNIFTHSEGYSESSYKSNIKTNSFGVFYRYYFRDKETSKWNVFAELSPSLEKSKEFSTELNINYNAESQNTQTLTDVTINRESNSLDGSISIGSSYQISPKWALQLSLRSIVQVQHQFGELKATRYRIFEQILSNNFFSVQYQF